MALCGADLRPFRCESAPTHGRIGVHQAAADRAAIADRWMDDMRDRLRYEGRVGCNIR